MCDDVARRVARVTRRPGRGPRCDHVPEVAERGGWRARAVEELVLEAGDERERDGRSGRLLRRVGEAHRGELLHPGKRRGEGLIERIQRAGAHRNRA